MNKPKAPPLTDGLLSFFLLLAFFASMAVWFFVKRGAKIIGAIQRACRGQR